MSEVSTATAFLNPSLTALLREQATAQLTDTCTIFDKAPGTVDAAGGHIPGTPGTGTVYPCRLQQSPSSQEIEREGKVRAEKSFTLVLPFDAVISPKQYVLVYGIRYEMVDNSYPATDRFTTKVTVLRIGS